MMLALKERRHMLRLRLPFMLHAVRREPVDVVPPSGSGKLADDRCAERVARELV